MNFPTVPGVSPSTEPNRFLQCGVFTVDLETRHAIRDDQYIPIPPCTFDYLVTLLRHSPETLSYQDLVSESQGERLPRLEAQDLARWRIYMLRKALEPVVDQPRYLLTVDGVGYRLVVE